MPERLQNLAAMLARILLCVVFLHAAYGKIANPKGTTAFMEARGMPAANVGLPVAIVVEIAGGLSLLLGLRARLGAFVLFVFLIPTTLYFHNFWTYPAEQVQGQMINFMKNLAIMGGLLMVTGFGAGGLAFDACCRHRCCAPEPAQA